jgi:hypothetical protein
MCGVSVPGGRVRKLSTAVAELWRIPKKSHSHAFSESVEEDLQLLGAVSRIAEDLLAVAKRIVAMFSLSVVAGSG